MAEKRKMHRTGAGSLGLNVTPRLRAKDQLHQSVNVPGRFWPALSRGTDKDKLFCCSVEEVSFDHQFGGRGDKMEDVRLTVDSSTSAEDKAGYWMNMLTYAWFKNDHGPEEVRSPSPEQSMQEEVSDIEDDPEDDTNTSV